ncbi:uncharacterized protein LOC127842128 [Dreissena polymorpha]|uniref:Uncharacterized protein n=1 Tax=Dreissena polymorpha TaxID=45954 RepID=A0A9D4IRL3_DREPO|nr:uncharacterized protein LOC127842128 [Dreissena polymorpha]KAH3782479.1 hypothetical protein DPMN_160394 [Dreissena polymorpha]
MFSSTAEDVLLKGFCTCIKELNNIYHEDYTALRFLVVFLAISCAKGGKEMMYEYDGEMGDDGMMYDYNDVRTGEEIGDRNVGCRRWCTVSYRGISQRWCCCPGTIVNWFCPRVSRH